MKFNGKGDYAYQRLQRKGVEVFVPMRWVEKTIGGKLQRIEVPVLHDLLIAHSTINILDDLMIDIPKLQYRYKIGGQRQKMVVSDKDMERFILATGNATQIDYYGAGEITSDMLGKKMKLIGGPLNGQEVQLLKMQGMRKKRIVVGIPDLVWAVVVLKEDKSNLENK